MSETAQKFVADQARAVGAPDPLWKVRDAAAYLNVAPSVVWELLRTGKLRRIKILNATRIHPDEVRRLARVPENAA